MSYSLFLYTHFGNALKKLKNVLLHVVLVRIFSGSILAEGWLNLEIQVALFHNIIHVVKVNHSQW